MLQNDIQAIINLTLKDVILAIKDYRNNDGESGQHMAWYAAIDGIIELIEEMQDE